MARHNEIGKIGEKIAADFLGQKGFPILERNYRKPYGEIDIIARDKSGALRFVEVKSVSWETGRGVAGNVSHGTIRPEENMTPHKVRCLLQTIEAYLVSHGTPDEWQFDVLAVYLDTEKKKARVVHHQNIVLGS